MHIFNLGDFYRATIEDRGVDEIVQIQKSSNHMFIAATVKVLNKSNRDIGTPWELDVWQDNDGFVYEKVEQA